MDEQQILATIVKRTREVLSELDERRFRHMDRLQELGARSVDRAEIVSLVIESLSLRIAGVEFFGPANIGERATLLREKLHG